MKKGCGPQLGYVLSLFVLIAVGVGAFWQASIVSAQEVPAPWRLDIDFGALSTDCAEEPEVTQIGDGWIRVGFVDDEGNRGVGYTKGTVLVYASPIESGETE